MTTFWTAWVGPNTLVRLQRIVACPDEHFSSRSILPTGHNWVDNFLIPTILFYKFQPAERENIFLKQLTMEHLIKYFCCWRFALSPLYHTQYIAGYLYTKCWGKLVRRQHAEGWADYCWVRQDSLGIILSGLMPSQSLSMSNLWISSKELAVGV